VCSAFWSREARRLNSFRISMTPVCTGKGSKVMKNIPFDSNIRRLLSLMALMDEENTELLDFADDKTFDDIYKRQNVPMKRALEAAVHALPEEQAIALMIIMYIGRDDESDPIDAIPSYIEAMGSRETAENKILEKTKRASFIQKGLNTLLWERTGVLLDEVTKILQRKRSNN
jgi:hypothetical protein